MGTPNPYYFKPFETFRGLHKKVGIFGRNMKLSSGSNWILGKDFAANLFYSATSYFSKNSLQIFDKSNSKWFELIKILEVNEFTIFTQKTKQDFIASLAEVKERNNG